MKRIMLLIAILAIVLVFAQTSDARVRVTVGVYPPCQPCPCVQPYYYPRPYYVRPYIVRPYYVRPLYQPYMPIVPPPVIEMPTYRPRYYYVW
jgi:hypothetical protein